MIDRSPLTRRGLMAALALRSNLGMAAPVLFRVRLLAPGDAALLEALSGMFGEAFGEAETYRAARPRAAYLERLLGGQSFIAIAALKRGEVVGGLGCLAIAHAPERVDS